MWRSIQPSTIDTPATHFMPPPDEGISLNILDFFKKFDRSRLNNQAMRREHNEVSPGRIPASPSVWQAAPSPQRQFHRPDRIGSFMHKAIRGCQTARRSAEHCIETDETPEFRASRDIFDELARDIALLFLNGRFDLSVSFAFLKRLVRLANFDLSLFAWDIFDAFASGAYRTDTYPSDLDPAVHHTLPRLRAILSTRRGTFSAIYIDSGSRRSAMQRVEKPGRIPGPDDHPQRTDRVLTDADGIGVPHVDLSTRPTQPAGSR
ncbi:hypothetical protein [Burkholderia sp. LMG 32019]|uniref:hypothetical protein n=1 Tax=Burkholderia sp. LMG 32019 TaxID=3158173 RepID=UPI003C2E7262